MAALSYPYPTAANFAIASFFINVLFVGLRIWARVLHNTRWTWADVFVPVALVLNLALATLVLVQTVVFAHPHGTPSTSSLKLSAFYIPMTYGIASAIPKLAVLDIYLAVFTSRAAKYTLLLTGFVIVGNAIAYVPTTVWQCTPIAFSWDHSIRGGKCNNIKLHFSLASVPNIVTDLVILGLPVPIIAKLRLERMAKAGVLATFLSGGIGLISSIIRFSMFLQWTPSSNETEKIGIASIAETTFYLVAACLLSMRPLISRFIKKTGGFGQKYHWGKSSSSRFTGSVGRRLDAMGEEEAGKEMDEQGSTRKLVLERKGEDGEGQRVVEVRRPERVVSNFSWK